MAIGAGVGLITKGVKAGVAHKKAKEEEKKQANLAKDKEDQLAELEKNRQAIVNPYGDMANEYENIGVATQASKFEAEEADMALANTLDAMMESGAGAGGATALARAALESKRGISASIQKQEQANQKARAGAAENVAKLKAAGEEWAFETQEDREVAKMSRTAAEMDNAKWLEQNAKAMKTQATMDMLGAVGDTAGALTDPSAMLGKGAGKYLGGLVG